MKLKDKVALVTGGNSGYGRGMVLAFLREGAKVAFCGRNGVKNEDTLREAEKSGDVLAIQCDVSSSREVREMFSLVLERFGSLDILVNNAAIFRSDEAGKRDRVKHLNLITRPGAKYSLGVTRNMSDEDWRRTIDVDLNGVFYCTREALNIMEDKGYGKIINIASTGGISGMSSHSPNYSAAKAGVIVNCIAPGGIATPQFIEAMDQWGPDVTARIMQVIPLGRFGTIDEYVSLAVYLASDESNYIVGQVISPNGGMLI